VTFEEELINDTNIYEEYGYIKYGRMTYDDWWHIGTYPSLKCALSNPNDGQKMTRHT
jgi:hypothetical protein